ncbi:murein biosynthesis integral membrane protein MurJ [Salinarimonas ramus]|uniref:Probable lipid II flippase MurJ n=1 Tax=Salinarimonas ramus TaxID=690164 RepID=A0A917Q6X4_9HYPH|nr:murein biosynthesis integral membrane protein MurJ [Salinarimonas ramus]GGK31645.1 putative lipid II flippase MurJ [Salinarimonas ramus]
MLKKIVSVGGWTLVSRVTGFARDVVMAAVLGAGPITDAFVVALRLPNHFRAIFGEGAFNAAFIPTYAQARAARGDADARIFAGRIASLVLAVQLLVLAGALAFMPQLVGLLAPGFVDDPERFELTVTLTRITFPYLLFVTLVTLFSAVLNAHDRFAAAAGAPILLNVSLIAGLLAASFFPSAGHAAAWAVAVAGVLELLLVWWDAAARGIAPKLARPGLDPDVRKFFRTLGPALIGSAGVQIAMFADTIIASLLPTGAVSAIYYADRLYQLPVGVIGIAAGTVLLPEMSRRIAEGDTAGAHASQNRAVGLVLALALPAAAAFVVVPDLIMLALFGRGAFTAADAAAAGAVLAAYATALPAVVLIRAGLASFHSRSDTATPLIASLTGVAVNVVFKILLTGPLGAPGLAFATAIGAWVNVALLFFLAWRRGWTAPDARLGRTLAVCLAGMLALAGAVMALREPARTLAARLPALDAEAQLAMLAVAGGLVYGLVVLAGLRLAGVRLARR